MLTQKVKTCLSDAIFEGYLEVMNSELEEESALRKIGISNFSTQFNLGFIKNEIRDVV